MSRRAIFTDKACAGDGTCLICDRTGQTVDILDSGNTGTTRGHRIRFDDGTESWATDHELEVIA